MQTCPHEAEKQPDQEIELIDIEDIVPVANANSLFLCVARALIYMSYKNEKLLKALDTCCSIKRSDLKSDIHFQSVLRLRLCEYLLDSAIGIDQETQMPYLRAEYSAHFEDNIYDFLIQLYQMSVNNYSSNSLYTKFAFKAMSKMLNLTICLKKVNGTWKYYEPISPEKLSGQALYETINGTNEMITESAREYHELLKYLNELNIYLYEFRTSSSKHRRKSVNVLCSVDANNGLKRQHSDINGPIRSSVTAPPSNSKILKILLSKRLWLKNFYENSRILCKFSQFNDPDELNAYNEQKILLNPLKLISIFREVLLKDQSQLKSVKMAAINQMRIFSTFVLNAPVDLLINCERDLYQDVQLDNMSKKSKMENQFYSDVLAEVYFNSKYNTIGKQFVKFFEARHSSKRFSPQDLLMMFLNHLWGKQMFSEEFVQKTLIHISNEIVSF